MVPQTSCMEIAMKIALLLPTMLALAFFGAQPQQDKIDQAKKDINILAKAAEIYQLHAGSLPDTLKKLAEKQQNPSIPQLIDEKLLIDPWGRAYKYDPKLLDPRFGSPLIWSEGPDPKDAKGWISNRDPKETPKKKRLLVLASELCN
jgi:Type II secretion system (T2SS), protein G